MEIRSFLIYFTVQNEHSMETPKLPPYFKPFLTIVCVIPLVLSFLFTEMQWYPATYVIEWLADESGMFSFRFALVLNWVLFLIPVLVVGILVLPLIKRRYDK